MQTFVQVNAEAHRAVSRLYLLGPEVRAVGINFQAAHDNGQSALQASM